MSKCTTSQNAIRISLESIQWAPGWVCGLTLIFSLQLTTHTDGMEQPPNIVLIMADDLGFSDLGCYGGEIETPHLDTLAKNGIRYTHFYNTSRCCPSRAALMTGKYQHRVEMGWMTAVDEHRSGYRGQLSSEHPTIAELLHAGGYQARMSGKWHLTVDTNFKDEPGEAPNGSWPTQRGFDEYYGGLSGGGGYYRPAWLAHDLTRIPTDSLPDDYYYTNAITEHAVEFIEDFEGDRPFFLYVAHYAPHRPLEAPKERVDRNRQRYRVGYDELRKDRFERQQRLGIFQNDEVLGESGQTLPSELPAWRELSEQQQAKWITEMATYAAMVEMMDEGIGQVVEALRAKGELDNTIIFFLSDNGATYEGGLISQLAADLSNTPYRNYKQFTHLGGVASPLIVHWPRGIESKNELRRDIAHINDVLPTCLDAAELDYPARFREEVIDGPDGQSLLPSFNRQPLDDRPLFWEHQSSRAIQVGRWRLVSLRDGSPWELYDLAEDPFEQHDLADRMIEKRRELAEQWKRWAESNDVLPLERRPWGERIRHYLEQQGD